jgi:hypothetical protein
VLAATGAPEVETVIVDGVVRKRDGVLVGIDRAALAARNSDVRSRVLSRIR